MAADTSVKTGSPPTENGASDQNCYRFKTWRPLRTAPPPPTRSLSPASPTPTPASTSWAGAAHASVAAPRFLVRAKIAHPHSISHVREIECGCSTLVGGRFARAAAEFRRRRRWASQWGVVCGARGWKKKQTPPPPTRRTKREARARARALSPLMFMSRSQATKVFNNSNANRRALARKRADVRRITIQM